MLPALGPSPLLCLHLLMDATHIEPLATLHSASSEAGSPHSNRVKFFGRGRKGSVTVMETPAPAVPNTPTTRVSVISPPLPRPPVQITSSLKPDSWAVPNRTEEVVDLESGHAEPEFYVNKAPKPPPTRSPRNSHE